MATAHFHEGHETAFISSDTPALETVAPIGRDNEQPTADYSAPNNSAEVESDSAPAIGSYVVLSAAEQTMLDYYLNLPPFGQELVRAMFDLLHKRAPRAALAEYIAAMPDTPDKAAWAPQLPGIIADWERGYDKWVAPEGGAE